MNKTAIYSSEHSWSRRCSTETVFSIQGQETDYVRDTSDTEASEVAEYEPVTDEEQPRVFSSTDASGESDNEIIVTKVISVSVGEEGELALADSEQTESGGSDSEIDLHDYWQCAQCRTANNNPLYRYCEKCFKVRKNLFPPRPKRRRKREQAVSVSVRALSQDSGVESQGLSQELSHADSAPSTSRDKTTPHSPPRSFSRSTIKRRADSVERDGKRQKLDDSDAESSADEVAPLIKTLSDPSVTIDDVKITKRVISETVKETVDRDSDNLCIMCLSEAKSGVFVHGRVAHICCCYKCAVKVWSTTKRCPICNCKVSNVLKAVVM